MDDQRLRPVERLRHPREFQQAFQHGKKLVAPTFVLYILPTSASHPRLGLAVSKRVGKAAVRNRIKRLLRELFRQHKALLQPACDVVFVARRDAATASFEEYTQQFLRLLCRYQPSGDAPGCDRHTARP
jgi:ribonuclease P protein component